MSLLKRKYNEYGHPIHYFIDVDGSVNEFEPF